MNTTTQTSDPADLEQQTNATREQVDRTLDELENRLSIKQRIDAASDAIVTAAGRASRLASPEITTMIRMDHTHVLAAFRRYRHRLSDARKRALVANVCLGLEIHAQLEEEIFYPALFPEGKASEDFARSVTEHDEMRELMHRMRQMSPRDPAYDETFYELIRTVLHHVADEETTLLPMAETRLKDRLRELGWQMTRRRLQLLKPRAAEAATTTAQTFPVLTGMIVAGVVTAAWLALRVPTANYRRDL